MTFTALAVPEDLITALGRQQITIPTAIQTAAIPLLREGRNAYLHAETGTGKTLAYLLPVFDGLDLSLAATQAVIVAPTHELAIQIQRQCTDLAQHAGRAARILLLIGGTALDRQLDKLKKKPHLVVGSPGRIRELVEMRKLKLQQLRYLIVDEADRLLGVDGLPDIRALIGAAPPTRQLVFVSATEDAALTATVSALAPSLAMVKTGAVAVNENIEHFYVVCDERDKPDMVRRIFHALLPERAMVFVHRNDTAAQVAALLERQTVPVADLSGTLNKLDRKQAMDGFRSGAVRVLLASDVAARGLDIKGVTHIINLDVPTQSRDYLHRVGRTGRAGARGVAITLMAEGDTRLVRRYEEELGIRLQQVRVRDGQVYVVGE